MGTRAQTETVKVHVIVVSQVLIMEHGAQTETVKVHVIVVSLVLITENGYQDSGRDSKGACDCGVAGIDHRTWGPGLRQ